MEYNVFLQKLESCVRKRVPIGYRVVINNVIKNNDQKFDAITIYKESQKIMPNIYVKKYYEEHLKGKTLNEIVDEIIVIHKANLYPKEYISDISNLANISTFIFYRLVNRKMNAERLQGLPFKVIGDLAKTYHVMAYMGEEGISSFTISNEMMDRWKIDIDIIDGYATENTQLLFPEIIKCLTDLISELILGLDNEVNQSKENFSIPDADWFDETKLYVLSNKFGINGASAILYKDVLKNISMQFNTDLYILPSSIHEVIIIPATDKLNISNLREMVLDVNHREVDVGEILSNEVYYYDMKKDEISIAD